RHRAPAREGPDAVGDQRRVAGPHRHVVGRDPELIRADLREGGLQALSVRLCASGHRDVAAWIDPNDGALIRTVAGALDVRGDPDPDAAPGIAGRCLFPPELLV